jgi:anaerobic magnesium-protoporphyrin IX monomethyl ester cyclase
VNSPDIVLCTLPKHGVNVPPLALPYLAGYVRTSGFTIETLDLNLDLWKRTKTAFEWHHIWDETDTTLFSEPLFSHFHNTFYQPILQKWAELLLSYNARYIGLSCFSYRSIPSLKELIRELKERQPYIKIIAGGAPVNSYSEQFIDQFGVTYAVKSEGEKALVEILKGNFYYPGIVSKERRNTEAVQIEHLDEVSFPDFKNIIFSDYVPGDPGGIIALREGHERRRQAGLMSSRGCVRACKFCDVSAWWPKFRSRSPENIFSEIVDLYNNYGVDEIYFHDSLINGSLTHLNELLDLLIENRKKMTLKLKGLAIIRPQPKSLYKKMSEAGFVQLQIGIESFSERLRDVMRKRFSDNLLAENLQNFAEAEIDIVLLLMSGYPSETKSDHQDNLSWIRNNFHFYNNPVKRLDFGGTTLILPGAPLFKDGEITFYEDSSGNWVSFTDEGPNTFELRVKRMQECEYVAKQVGWKIGTSYSGGVTLLGDTEKQTIKDRPQDNFKKLELHDAAGWLGDPKRPIAGFQN